MLPFLYSTRTIAPLRRSFIGRSRSRHLPQVQSFHSIKRRLTGQTAAREVQTGSSDAAEASSHEDVIPWEEGSVQEEAEESVDSVEPELRVGEATRNVAIDEWEDADVLDSQLDDQKTITETSLEEILTEEELISRGLIRPRAQSTITISERQAFQRIFAAIMTRSKEPDYYINDPVEMQRLKIPGKGFKTASKTMDNLLEKAIADSERQTVLVDGTPDLVDAVEKYPLSLRMAAAKAIGLVTGKAPRKPKPPPTTHAMAEVQNPKRDRVEQLMRAATNDFELWQVMEDEVFSLGSQFAVEEEPLLTSDINKKKKMKLNLAADRHREKLEKIHIFGPLYPSFLLLGFRLLDRGFARPSSLALYVLPRIKSLGLVSHAFGASTALYNELLRLYWFRYNDGRRCVELLKEMERVGLDMDEETLAILNSILAEQVKVKNGASGEAVKQLWTLPEFSATSFIPWWKKAQAIARKK